MLHITKNAVDLKCTVNLLKPYNSTESYKLDPSELKEFTRLKKDLFNNLPYDLNNYMIPSLDYTNKIHLMRYCNNNLSYGISFDFQKLPNVNKITFHICKSPILSSVIYEILETFDNYEDMKNSFYKYK